MTDPVSSENRPMAGGLLFIGYLAGVATVLLIMWLGGGRLTS